MKKRVFLLAVLAGVLALPVVLYVRVRIAERAWARSFGPLEELPDRFRGEKNETTEMIPEWFSALGMTVTGDPPPTEVLNAVKEYGGQYKSDSWRPAAPEPAVERYVLSRAGALDSMATWMEGHPPPSWPVTLHPLESQPNFLPLMQLQKILLAAALVRDWRGDHRGGERLLVASWKLNESLRKRPDWFAQFIAVEVLRMQGVVIRKMEVDPVVWRKRLAEHDYRASLAAAHQAGTYMMMRMVKTNFYADPDYIALKRVLGGGMPEFVYRPRWRVLLTTPIRWFDLPALIEGSRQQILAAQNAPIDERADLREAYDRGFSKWSYISEPDLPPQDLSSAFTRLDRALAEAELTDKILIARAARAANGGRWPRSIAGFESSQVKNGHWIYEASARGVSIRFSREVRWPSTIMGDSAPLRYTATSSS